jgi:hypothetical protein
MKLDNYRQELDQCMQMKNLMQNQSNNIKKESVKQDINNIQQYAQKELSNMAAYRSKFQHKDEVMRVR